MNFEQAVWAWVSQVPRGKVVTYGQAATCLGCPRAARAVGRAMFRAQGSQVPWQRVINSKGEISIGGHLHRPDMQRQMLNAEGVEFDEAGRVDLRTYQWHDTSSLADFSAHYPTAGKA